AEHLETECTTSHAVEQELDRTPKLDAVEANGKAQQLVGSDRSHARRIVPEAEAGKPVNRRRIPARPRAARTGREPSGSRPGPPGCGRRPRAAAPADGRPARRAGRAARAGRRASAGA